MAGAGKGRSTGNNPEDCPVCLTNFDIMQRPHNLPCGHTVCMLCIDKLKEQGRVSCPECRVSHAIPEGGQFPVSFIAEAFIRKMRGAKVAATAASLLPSAKKRKRTAEPADSKEATGFSKKMRFFLQEQEDTVVAAITACRETQSQLDQYQTTLTGWGKWQQQLEDRLQGLVDQSRSAIGLVQQEESRTTTMEVQVKEVEQALQATQEKLHTLKTEEEVGVVVIEVIRCTGEAEQVVQECQECFPDANTVTTIRKVIVASSAALDTSQAVQAALETPTVTTEEPRPQSDPTEPRPQSDPAEPRSQSDPAEPRPQSDPAEPRPQSDPAEPSPQSDPAKPRSQSDPAKPRPQSDPAKPRPQSDPAEPRPQSDPAKPRPQSDPAKPRPQSDPAKPRPQSDPAKPRPQSDPAKPRSQSDPAKPRSQSDPAKPRPQSDPAKSRPQSDPAKPRPQSDPAEPRPQSDPAEPRSQSDPAKPRSQSDPAKPRPQSDPAEPRPQSDPAKPRPQSDPAKPRPQSDPAKPRSQSDPAKAKSQSDPAKPRSQSDPAKPRPQSDPAEPRPQSDPAEPRPQSDPAELRPQSDPAEPRPQSDPAKPRPQSDPAEPRAQSDPAEPRPQSDPDSTIMDRVKLILTLNLKTKDLRSLSQPPLSLIQAGQVFAVCQVEGQRRLARISFEASRLCLHALKEQHHSLDAATLQVSMVVPPSPPCMVFLDLSWPGSSPRRVQIHLSPDTPWGRQFMMMCTGQHGPSYLNTRLFSVGCKGKPGEYVVGGHHKSNDDTLNEGAYSKSGRAGAVRGMAWKDGTQGVCGLFAICTRECRNDIKLPRVFGEVVNGLHVVAEAAQHIKIGEVTVVDCGVVL
ncbi:histone-lysine N-methyltransferase 2D-like isoform X18 [Eriocheir sinensis]|uniref:histone-lysine N-methyltransferase 2D-like isoform X16 n=1 Tax=Eriocheir sinensis TaxID=95602 RepID=UPI0021C62D81|nr:histone-lysine N-methyltransferase 2D-like isoform X16 [Eriocheir sinensis]XP_050721433.1 histone-lysine N-methyltransferase 2D-like isoform X18 [Eriocheir sinensis]